MLRFTKMKLTGFKSFVDAAELHIEPGLTGVVGPNGCGKSNLVEALRWVMGETSARQMRGDDMDDVIFGGTSTRPARNIAEVVLHLDNSTRRAPAHFNDADELEVSRRIERTKGSTYRINGREVRARDVQLLFADAATGARSTALVSQGRIGAVISAKPQQRRMLLEEAAGITGLHSRRHEAELRLRGAEGNLERLDDILGTLGVQLESLRKQARQATRYRNLSDHIRKAEATVYHLRWTTAVAALETARRQLGESEFKVTDLARLAAAAQTKQAEAATVLPELRRLEVEAAAEVQRLNLGAEALAAEERRIAEQFRDAEIRLGQTDADREREGTLAADATAAMTRLEEEAAAINLARHGEEEAEAEAAARLARAGETVAELDARLAQLTDRVATQEAERSARMRGLEDARSRMGRLASRLAEMAGARAALEAESIDASRLEEAESRLEEATKAAEQARMEAEKAEAARQSAIEARSAAEADLHEAKSAVNGLEAEERTLSRMLESGSGKEFPPLIDAVDVASGLEGALGAALGDDLSAPVDVVAPVRWRTMGEMPAALPLPTGAEPLELFVKAPPALARRLAQIGLVDDASTGERLALSLAQGQRLVSREGGLWRWDGFTIAAGAPTAAAIRLEQRNRLNEVRQRLKKAMAAVATAAEAAEKARALATERAEAEKTAREGVRASDATYGRAREALASIKEQAARQNSRLMSLLENIEAAEAERALTQRQEEEAAALLQDMPDTVAMRDEVAVLRAELAESRNIQVDRQAAHANLIREAGGRRSRLEAIARELASWRERKEGAASRLAQLEERRQMVARELARLKDRPQAIAQQRSGLAAAQEEAEKKRKAAADRLAEAEGFLAEMDHGLKAAEQALSQAREERVRAEAVVEQGKQTCRNIAERIAERLDCRPDDTQALAELGPDEPLPEIGAMETRLERLVRERETMGPVNLRADQEMQELSDQIAGLESERRDLMLAIEKLRQGINELNSEGRERLLTSFREVDTHFQELFVRLFGGGRAHLTLTESDDPLEAGLEIMASPPGKRLQMLSLLSGGEQALTALALLFGVFMTNPAPICVLDEVDAPLDDANVDRVCTLLEEMALAGLTRFLVVTHHRMTMARMDRLFGVTMGERGVSQLVSVDLRQAEALVPDKP